MKKVQGIWLVLLVLFGSRVMGAEYPFNDELRQEFRASINYPLLLERKPPERQIPTDWLGELVQVEDSRGVVWQGKVGKPGMGSLGETEWKVVLESHEGTVLVNLVSLAGDWPQRLDYVINRKSLTNRTAVNATLGEGPGDLCLVPRFTPRGGFISFLYGNFYVDLRCFNGDCPVELLAQVIFQHMEKYNHQLPKK